MANQYTKRKEQQAAASAAGSAPRSGMAGIDRGNLEGAGIPDSRVFATPNPEVEAERSAERAVLRTCHVNGKPWRDLPEIAQQHIRYEMTDEGIAAMGGKVYADVAEMNRRTAVTREEIRQDDRDLADHRDPGKAFQQFGDMRERANDSRHASRMNPMERLVKKYLPVGHKEHWMAEDTRQMLGDRGYEIVLDEKGNMIKVGDLFLTSKPAVEVALDRQEEREEHADLLKHISEETAEQNKQVLMSKTVGQRGPDVLPTSQLPAKFGLHQVKGEIEALYGT